MLGGRGDAQAVGESFSGGNRGWRQTGAEREARQGMPGCSDLVVVVAMGADGGRRSRSVHWAMTETGKRPVSDPAKQRQRGGFERWLGTRDGEW